MTFARTVAPKEGRTQPSANPHQRRHAPAAAVAAIREEPPRVGVGAPAAAMDGRHPQSCEPAPRQGVEIALPAPLRIGGECGRGPRVGGEKRGAHLLADLEVRLPDRRARARRAAPRAGCRSPVRWPPTPRRPARASRHAQRRPRSRPPRRAAPACNRPPGWRRSCLRYGSPPHRPDLARVAAPARRDRRPARRGPARARQARPATRDARAAAARFSTTARGSSPTCAATLQVSKGGWLTAARAQREDRANLPAGLAIPAR